jgi:hypothetical protein
LKWLKSILRPLIFITTLIPSIFLN